MKGPRHHRIRTPRNRDTGWNLGARKPRCRNARATSGYRYYTPELGRWINRDPIGESGGLLLHGFVRNRPVSVYDLLGMLSKEVLLNTLRTAGVVYKSYCAIGCLAVVESAGKFADDFEATHTQYQEKYGPNEGTYELMDKLDASYLTEAKAIYVLLRLMAYYGPGETRELLGKCATTVKNVYLVALRGRL